MTAVEHRDRRPPLWIEQGLLRSPPPWRRAVYGVPAGPLRLPGREQRCPVAGADPAGEGVPGPVSGDLRRGAERRMTSYFIFGIRFGFGSALALGVTVDSLSGGTPAALAIRRTWLRSYGTSRSTSLGRRPPAVSASTMASASSSRSASCCLTRAAAARSRVRARSRASASAIRMSMRHEVASACTLQIRYIMLHLLVATSRIVWSEA